eukprot:1143892-Pelagomonas_calceolata.AAC.9
MSMFILSPLRLGAKSRRPGCWEPQCLVAQTALCWPPYLHAHRHAKIQCEEAWVSSPTCQTAEIGTKQRTANHLGITYSFHLYIVALVAAAAAAAAAQGRMYLFVWKCEQHERQGLRLGTTGSSAGNGAHRLQETHVDNGHKKGTPLEKGTCLHIVLQVIKKQVERAGGKSR